MRDDRLEVELRAALHREMAMARLGVTAPQIRAGIAARERSRHWTRAAAGIAAALAVVLVGVPILAPLAQRALSADATMGLMLPCNVTVEADPAGGSLARIVDPQTMLQVGELAQNAALKEVAAEAYARLERVAQKLSHLGD